MQRHIINQMLGLYRELERTQAHISAQMQFCLLTIEVMGQRESDESVREAIAEICGYCGAEPDGAAADVRVLLSAAAGDNT